MQPVTSAKWAPTGSFRKWSPSGNSPQRAGRQGQRQAKARPGRAVPAPTSWGNGLAPLTLRLLRRARRGLQAPPGCSASWGRRWVSRSSDRGLLGGGLAVRPHPRDWPCTCTRGSAFEGPSQTGGKAAGTQPNSVSEEGGYGVPHGRPRLANIYIYSPHSKTSVAMAWSDALHQLWKRARWAMSSMGESI